MGRRALERARFLRLWSRLGATGRGDPAFDRLEAGYGEPHRVYHTAEHIRDCLERLDESTDEPTDPPLEAALWFHDAVYDPHRDDNEAASAALAEQLLTQAAVPATMLTDIQRLILLTRHLDTTSDAAGRLMCDVDLSILGRSPAEFEEFERRIRAEYAWVPENHYRKGRSRILAGFLARPALYQTPYFRNRYEESARLNLQGLLARLGE
jgi:predicted metal-dependent HD superfamily phosphohydrolase